MRDEYDFIRSMFSDDIESSNSVVPDDYTGDIDDSTYDYDNNVYTTSTGTGGSFDYNKIYQGCTPVYASCCTPVNIVFSDTDHLRLLARSYIETDKELIITDIANNTYRIQLSRVLYWYTEDSNKDLDYVIGWQA